jgi:hypothetical protein
MKSKNTSNKLSFENNYSGQKQNFEKQICISKKLAKTATIYGPASSFQKITMSFQEYPN